MEPKLTDAPPPKIRVRTSSDAPPSSRPSQGPPPDGRWHCGLIAGHWGVGEKFDWDGRRPHVAIHSPPAAARPSTGTHWRGTRGRTIACPTHHGLRPSCESPWRGTRGGRTHVRHTMDYCARMLKPPRPAQIWRECRFRAGRTFACSWAPAVHKHWTYLAGCKTGTASGGAHIHLELGLDP